MNKVVEEIIHMSLMIELDFGLNSILLCHTCNSRKNAIIKLVLYNRVVNRRVTE